MIEASAEKKVPTAVPESNKVTLDVSLKNFEKRKTHRAESKAPAKAKKVVWLKKENADSGIRPDKTAPKVAPEHTPIIPGSASGFLKKP